MDADQIPAKSDKGREEIETRANKLDFRRRQLLILVDGKTSVSELQQKVTHVGDVTGHLNYLAQEGFVMLPAGRLAAAAPVASTPDVSVPASIPTAGPVDPERLDAAKRMASRLMYDAMGPDAEMFTIKLEAAKDRENFLTQLAKSRNLLQQVRGTKKSEQFWQTVIATLA